MAAIHLRAYDSELPVCRWKEAYRHYILTDDKAQVTCKTCLGTIHFSNYRPKGKGVIDGPD